MRAFVLILFVTLAATGCQGAREWIDDRTILQREQEKLGLEEKRKLAIIDLSNHPPSNGEEAYFAKQAEQRGKR